MYAEQMIKCTECENSKSESEFYNYKHERRCKQCVSEIRKAAYKANPEKHRKAKSDFTKSNPDNIRNTKLKQTYGITLKQYNDMLAKQNYGCAICGKPETAVWRGRTLSLAVDHCHTTDKVRGLLCMKCNRAFGLLEENTTNMLNMIEYAKNHLK